MANVASPTANGNGGKKRRKGDLKPIVTGEGFSLAESGGSSLNPGYVLTRLESMVMT